MAAGGSASQDRPRGQSAAGDAPPALSILEWCRAERQRAEPYWQPVHEAMLEERSFYDGQHYHEDVPQGEAHPDALYFVGQETFNVVRHKLAQLTDSPTTTEARPVDRLSDDDDANANDAEVATALLAAEVENPQKDFDDCFELMGLSALASRIGIVWLDWDPDCGAFGEILPRPVDATRVMWEPGFHDPHHLACRWMSEDVVMRLDALRNMPGVDREIADRLEAETGQAVEGKAASGTTQRHQDLEHGVDQPQERVLVRRWWFKSDPTTTRKARPNYALPVKDRYMVCGSPEAMGCGWRGEPQGGGRALPEETADGCPQCGGPTMRVDERTPEDEVLVYPKGKRLVFETPNQPQERPVYDGPWPTVKFNPKRNLRSFPAYVFTAYLPADPTAPTGPSDTRLNWPAQAASDYLMTKAFRSAKDFQRYYLMPETGINDYRGLRFEFKDDQHNFMFFDPAQTARLGPDGARVQVVDGSQFDPSMPSYWGMVQQVLNAKQGIADFGMTPQSSKNIPATTVAQMTQLAELPIAHLKRRYQRAKSKGHGVLWDMIAATYTPARLRRMRIGNGVDQVLEVHGDQLPNFDFVIGDAPTFDGLEKSKSEALDRLIAVPPEWQEVYAEVNNLPPSVLRKVQKVQAQRQAKMQTIPGATGSPDGTVDGALTTGMGGMPNGTPVPPGGPVNRVQAMMLSQR